MFFNIFVHQKILWNYLAAETWQAGIFVEMFKIK